jgi:hypothetical protein
MSRFASGAQVIRQSCAVGCTLLILAVAGCAGRVREVRKCDRPPDPNRALDLTQAADRTHLRHDAESAETIAIHYSDVSPARRQGKAEYAHARDECMDSLFAAIARTHGLDTAQVRAYTAVRDRRFDAGVTISFALLYALVAFVLAGSIVRAWGRDDRAVALVWLIGLSCSAAIIATMAFDLWATTAESLRLGSWHLSYRAARLPWNGHRVMFLTGSVGLFWLITLARLGRRVDRSRAT